MIKKYQALLRLYITGFIMGVADLIPGVSGGTVAFVSGIYEELLESIKIVSGKGLKLLLEGKIVEATKVVPLRFLLPLMSGIFSAIFFLAKLFSYLLENQAKFVWALFFGMVAASTYAVAKRVVKWHIQDVVYFFLSAGFAYWLVSDKLISTPETLPMIFLSGAIAICAMILPGISGSFILVLLGKYEYMLNALIDKNLPVVIAFILGAALGLSVFARFLSWLFKEHHDISVVILAGFMLGSLRKIWPFSDAEGVDFSNLVVWLLVIVGALVVLILSKHNDLKERTQDLKNKGFNKAHAEALKKAQ